MVVVVVVVLEDNMRLEATNKDNECKANGLHSLMAGSRVYCQGCVLSRHSSESPLSLTTKRGGAEGAIERWI